MKCANSGKEILSPNNGCGCPSCIGPVTLADKLATLQQEVATLKEQENQCPHCTKPRKSGINVGR